ncbi:MAG TPA: MXAN_5187 C-terminal domain-containing protein [Myxococcota bacterium]
MRAETLDELLQSLDLKLSQLRRDYDQYFLGTRPREPALLRGEVQKHIVMLTNQPIQNTALRFKFSSICSRYQAFKRQWDETLRKIEEGTYERHRFKAKIHGSKGRGAGGRAAAPKSAQDDLFESYRDARLACGQNVKGLTREKLEQVLERQRSQLRKKFGDDAQFRFRVAVEQGRVRLKATRRNA